MGSIYDRNGNLRQRTSYAGAITPPVAGLGPVFSPAIANHDRGSISRLLRSQGGDRTTTWAYDASNRQVLQVDALGAVTQTTYGANTVSTKAYANAIGVAGWQAADFTPARVLGTVQGSGQDRV
ncbi:hypothetical protein, partial [Raoultella sp. 18079]|uniref:hypothetical protein n=1 Tax=Raoultella sp. 18079 TaxID=2681458 RepID=UPI00135716EA